MNGKTPYIRHSSHIGKKQKTTGNSESMCGGQIYFIDKMHNSAKGSFKVKDSFIYRHCR